MDRERWHKVDGIFKSALERPEAERAAFLAEACAGDAELRREVESLIAFDGSGGFLEDPALGEATRLLAERRAAQAEGREVGPYKILRELGAGGMGVVYLAEDAKLGRAVALKLLSPAYTRDAERLRRFEREACNASALNHPNILTVHDIGANGEEHFIATEFVEGETLRARLGRGPLSPAEALDIAAQVADALDAAHEKRIVHRDIKPENIMLRRRDRYVKVLDFGLSKLVEPASPAAAAGHAPTSTATGVVMGTPRYMSPEQARGQAVDERTDIWSLGVVLYEMLAGTQPFAGETAQDTIASILRDEPRVLPKDAPDSLRRVVSKALGKRRDERYQTAAEMLSDLRGIYKELELSSGGEWRRAERTDGAGDAGDAGAAPTTGATPERPTVLSSLLFFRAAGARKFVLVIVAVVVLTLTAASFYYFRGGEEDGAVDSLAVLPFRNESGDSEAEYFSDGVTESLINSLSELPNLKVMSHSSVFRYRGRETDVQTAAEQLGVRAVLTGRVTQRGDTLSVSAELVDARDNRHLWGRQYNRRLSDILAVQQEIARDISARLRARLTGEQLRRVTRSYTENVEAYQFYLRGRRAWSLHTPQSLTESIEHFDRAIAVDPTYALAYAGLAHAYGSLANWGVIPLNEGYLKAKRAAERAVELDDSLADGHAAIAFIKTFYEWDWEGARRASLRALELNPNNSNGHALYMDYLTVTGRLEEALAEAVRWQELDPFLPFANAHLGFRYYLLGRHDEAVVHLKKALDLEPKFLPAHQMLGTAYESKGMYAEAVAVFDKAIEVVGRDPSLVALRGHTCAVSGRRAEALKALDELKAMSDKRPVSSFWFALVYTGLGDREQAFAWLDKAYSERFFFLKLLKIDPRLAPLRPDLRYARLLQRMGLT